MDRDHALKIIDAVLFVSDAPVPLENLHSVLEAYNRDEIREMINELNGKYEQHGLHIAEIAEGFQMRTRPECADWVKKFHKINRSTRLSQAALESLSIIAYRQPITRQEIEDIRGVDCSGVLKNLLDKNLVKSLGRRKVAGKPVTFGTTKKFLEYFGLMKLTDLPTLKDLPGDEAAVMQEALKFGERPEPAAEDYEADGETEEKGEPFEYTRGDQAGNGNGDPDESNGHYEDVEDFDGEEPETGESGAEFEDISNDGEEPHAEPAAHEDATDEGGEDEDTDSKNSR